MEQAPPPLPPPPPPPPAETPSLYMTPYLAKRHDGLMPSLLLPGCTDGSKTNIGGVNKSYQTKSTLLLQVPVPLTDKDRPMKEFQTILDSVNATMDENIDPTGVGDLLSVSFEPSGCEWTVELSRSVGNEAAQSFRLSVIIFMNEIHDVTNYIIDTRLQPKKKITDSTTLPLKGYTEAKAVFDFFALQIRKAIVRLEFPEFPEGCKGRPFREIYQLNARVSE
jgi:hypothetical protein